MALHKWNKPEPAVYNGQQVTMRVGTPPNSGQENDNLALFNHDDSRQSYRAAIALDNTWSTMFATGG
eukprot:2332922-Amphidinium_carterae.1